MGTRIRVAMLLPSSRGYTMTPKVVRAYSLDMSTVEDLEYHTQVPGKSKPMNKSKYVNEALKFYMGTNIKEMIEQNRTLKENLTAGLRAKDASIQGLEQHLANANDAIDGLEGYIRSLEDRIVELNHEIRDQQDCRCLWCRLKKHLQK
jgi:peptidoglycan hydrolase CwlO-like protein